jgi:hypothetical protein
MHTRPPAPEVLATEVLATGPGATLGTGRGWLRALFTARGRRSGEVLLPKQFELHGGGERFGDGVEGDPLGRVGTTTGEQARRAVAGFLDEDDTTRR